MTAPSRTAGSLTADDLGRTVTFDHEMATYTEWGLGDEKPILRETRYPSMIDGAPDRLPCEHHVPRRAATPPARRADADGAEEVGG